MINVKQLISKIAKVSKITLGSWERKYWEHYRPVWYRTNNDQD